MKKLVIATAFAVVALSAHSADACDLNRQASANAPVVAATAPATEQTKAAVPPVASDESNRKVVDDPKTIVLITDRH